LFRVIAAESVGKVTSAAAVEICKKVKTKTSGHVLWQKKKKAFVCNRK